MNAALLDKWLWQSFNRSDLLWYQLIKLMCYKQKYIWEDNAAHTSYFWKGAMNQSDSFACFSKN